MKLTAPFGIALAVAATLLTACSAGSSGATTGSASAASEASANKQSGPTLTGKPWALTAVTGETPAFQGVVPDYQQPDYTITFNTDGTYSGTAACNQIAGTYKTSGNNLTITAGASTLALCPDLDYGTIDYGSIFAHALTTASTYAVTSDTLKITLSDGGTMTFGPLQAVPSSARSSAVASLAPGASPPAELLGRTWKLTGITEMTPAFQGVVPEADQSKYTIEFQANGTFNATADCNQVGGTYEVHRGGSSTGTPLEPGAGGGSISILPGPSTLAACPPGSLADLFVIGLGSAAGFTIAADQLTLTLGDGQPYALQFTA